MSTPAPHSPHFIYHALGPGGRLDLAMASREILHLVHGSGRGLKLELPAGWLSAWIPLRGAPELRAAGGDVAAPASAPTPWPLPGGRLLVARGSLLATTPTPASFLVLAGMPAPWSELLRSLPEQATASDVFARQCACPRQLRRAAVHLARHLRDAHVPVALADAQPALRVRADDPTRAFARALLDAQRELQPLIDRCNGRTPQRRRLTLQRLLRTHALIERAPQARLELTQLAHSANYSPWHLIRMYREVFGETPSEHAARLRLEQAWTLVRDSAMPVCVITQHLGYESQSAFCRAFKNAFGLTTTQLRHLPLPPPRPVHLRAGVERGRPRVRAGDGARRRVVT